MGFWASRVGVKLRVGGEDGRCRFGGDCKRSGAGKACVHRTLLDDLFMGLVFEDRRCIELVLRIILGIDDLCVEENQVKHTMANLVGRSAQIDVLAVDGRGRRYDIEV